MKIDHHNPHQLAKSYPLMGFEEYIAFREDIRANGQREPIWLYEQKILEGRHRARACSELGIEPLTREFEGTLEEAKKFVDSMNLHRRHMTPEARQERVTELKAEGLSNRAIAETVGCSEGTVRNDLKAGAKDYAPEPEPAEASHAEEQPAEPATEIDEHTPPAPNSTSEPEVASETEEPPQADAEAPKPQPKVKGRDGKSYPAQRPSRGPKMPANPRDITIRQFTRQLEQLEDAIVPFGGLWKKTRKLNDEDKKEISEVLEQLSQTLHERALELSGADVPATAGTP